MTKKTLMTRLVIPAIVLAILTVAFSLLYQPESLAGNAPFEPVTVAQAATLDSQLQYAIVATAEGNMLYGSSNGGEDWWKMPINLPLRDGYESMAVADMVTLEDGTLYIATTNDGLFRLKDRGRALEVVEGLPYAMPIQSLKIDADGQTLYLSADNTLYQSNDAGYTWSVAKSLQGQVVD